MTDKTHKNYKKHQINYLPAENNYAKKGTELKCKLKSCISKKYQSVYGASTGGSIRKTIQSYF